MKNKLLLCTDLDRTLIPNGIHPESSAARRYFNHLVSHPDIVLTYVSGRDKLLVQEAIAEYQLPVPDYVIADVGASLYALKTEKKTGQMEWSLWHEWSSFYSQDWKGQINDDIAALFSDRVELEKQPVTKQKIYKLSYFVPLNRDHESLFQSMQEKLDSAGLNAALIWSVDEAVGIGLLDVMPRHATKRYAIEFLMQEQKFALEHTLFAGDSGNDLDVLLSPIQSILVANAHKDVKDKIQEFNHDAGSTINHSTFNLSTYKSPIYIAQGGFKNMNGNYSAGIVEGVQHYVPQIEQWLEKVK